VTKGIGNCPAKLTKSLEYFFLHPFTRIIPVFEYFRTQQPPDDSGTQPLNEPRALSTLRAAWSLGKIVSQAGWEKTQWYQGQERLTLTPALLYQRREKKKRQSSYS